MRYVGNIAAITSIGFVMFNYINVFLNIKLTKKQLKYIAVGLIVAISIIAILTKPHKEDDLTRHFVHLEGFRKKGFGYLKDFPYTINLIIVLLYYLVSLTPWNNLLPLIVVLIFYSSLFLFIYKVQPSLNNTRYISIYVIILASFVYLNETVSGVRFPLATGTFVLVYVFDKNRNKLYNLLYIVPLLIHQTTIMFLIVLLVSKISIYLKGSNIKFKIEYLLLLVPYVGLLISYFIPKGIPLVSKMFELLRTYANPGFYLEFFDYRVEACVLSLFAILLYIFYKNRKELQVTYGKLYYNFYKCLLIFCLGLMPFPIIHSRYLTLVFILSLPLIQSIKLLDRKIKRVLVCAIVVICIGLFAFRMVNAYHYWRFY